MVLETDRIQLGSLIQPDSSIKKGLRGKQSCNIYAKLLFIPLTALTCAQRILP
jgi:hypothetical protein